jgi:hypothetical protein
MRYSQLVFVLGIFLASAGVAEEAPTTIGVLTCTLVDGTIEGGRKITCGFRPTGIATDEKYEGTLQGLGQWAAGKQVLVWSVIGPANKKPSLGFLAQRYSRVKLAGHPPSWVGQTSPIVPLFETHTDAELGNAITEIELKLSGTSA